MRTYKKVIFVVIFAALSLTCLTGGVFIIQSFIRQNNALAFYQNLGAGWNLGNTLDCHSLHFETDNPSDYEVYWGNPETTKELFEKIRDAGFKTVRIPVTWYPHMDANNKVNGQWMQRVREVVDYALSSDMYVILNIHHEEWLVPSQEKLSRVETQFIALWQQIADAFADYDERLLFEGMNEPRLIGADAEWTEGTADARDTVNRLNQVFVDTIRASGGNNPERRLLVPTYCAKTYENVIKDFKKPDDINVGVSVHIYSPFEFAQDDDGTKEWDSDNREDRESLDKIFKYIRTYFLDRKIPVVITEFGAKSKNNESSRIKWTKYIVNFAADNKIPYIWWDDGGKIDEKDTYSIFNRHNFIWKYPEILKELTRDESTETSK